MKLFYSVSGLLVFSILVYWIFTSDDIGSEQNTSSSIHLAKGQASTHTVDLNTSVDLEMIWVEPGTFTMGQDGVGTPVRKVTHKTGFYLGKYEVTQAQYEAVMKGNRDGLSATPSHWPNNPNRPVEGVSWDDIQVFLTRLNNQQSDSIPGGWAYVLPTEAEWEYACRAGTTTAYSWGETISSDKANYNWDGKWNAGADFQQTRDVGLYSANQWGFFDMSGNVWEWTSDWYETYSTGTQTDIKSPTAGSSRVYRGGSWGSAGALLISAYRNNTSPNGRSNGLGFRIGFKQQ